MYSRSYGNGNPTPYKQRRISPKRIQDSWDLWESRTIVETKANSFKCTVPADFLAAKITIYTVQGTQENFIHNTGKFRSLDVQPPARMKYKTRNPMPDFVEKLIRTTRHEHKKRLLALDKAKAQAERMRKQRRATRDQLDNVSPLTMAELQSICTISSDRSRSPLHAPHCLADKMVDCPITTRAGTQPKDQIAGNSYCWERKGNKETHAAPGCYRTAMTCQLVRQKIQNQRRALERALIWKERETKPYIPRNQMEPCVNVSNALNQFSFVTADNTSDTEQDQQPRYQRLLKPGELETKAERATQARKVSSKVQKVINQLAGKSDDSSQGYLSPEVKPTRPKTLSLNCNYATPYSTLNENTRMKSVKRQNPWVKWDAPPPGKLTRSETIDSLVTHGGETEDQSENEYEEIPSTVEDDLQKGANELALMENRDNGTDGNQWNDQQRQSPVNERAEAARTAQNKQDTGDRRNRSKGLGKTMSITTHVTDTLV